MNCKPHLTPAEVLTASLVYCLESRRKRAFLQSPPPPAWLESEKETQSAKIGRLQKIRENSRVLDWSKSKIGLDEKGEWEAQPRVVRSHESTRKAKREAFHARKDGWIPPSERAEVAEKVIAKKIRQIACRGQVITSDTSARFSPLDASQAARLALVESGFFTHGFLTLPVFRAIRNHIQGRDCFRLRCKWEDSTDQIAMVAAEAGFMTEVESPTRNLTRDQIKIAREIMRTLRASRESDKSRKAEAAFRSHREFFLFVFSRLTRREESRSMNPGTFDTRKSRFLDYLAKGAIHLRETKQPLPRNLGEEIMQALASRFL